MKSEKIKLLKSQLGENRLKENIDVSEFLATKKGTTSAGFCLAATTSELIKIINLCRELQLEYLIIGSGSKTDLSDKTNFVGLIIKNRADSLKIFGIKGKISKSGLGISEAFIEADSGASLIAVSAYARKQTLSGLESLSKITGTIGGSIHTNLDLRQQIYQVQILNSRGEIKFALLNEIKIDDIILSVSFKLKSHN